MSNRIEYSEKYTDDKHEYRHVILPKELAKTLPRSRLLTENEWRGIGVQQSRGWQHYAIHRCVLIPQTFHGIHEERALDRQGGGPEAPRWQVSRIGLNFTMACRCTAV